MFKDYYAILDVPEKASLEEIRAAFKKLVTKWHPDKNIGFDTTEIMQDINEAYLILKDFEARLKYDKEYQLFKDYRNEFQKAFRNNPSANQKSRNYYNNYKVKDLELEKRIKNAGNQALDLSKQIATDFNGMMRDGCSVSSGIATKTIVSILIATLLWLILYSVSKSHN